jgi:hypothetical protein
VLRLHMQVPITNRDVNGVACNFTLCAVMQTNEKEVVPGIPYLVNDWQRFRGRI